MKPACKVDFLQTIATSLESVEGAIIESQKASAHAMHRCAKLLEVLLKLKSYANGGSLPDLKTALDDLDDSMTEAKNNQEV